MTWVDFYLPGNVGLFDGAAGAEAALLGMVCLVVAVAGILRILTCAEGRAADKVLKSFCSENSSIPPFTRIGKFSRPLAEKKPSKNHNLILPEKTSTKIKI